MEMTGEYRIGAPRQRVWEALNDPEVLKQCIPGCDELERVSDTEMAAKVTAKVGPVKAKFRGGVTLSEIVIPESYVITGEGKGGAAGFAKGSARVNLLERDGATVLHYEAHAQVGGKLAQLGARLVGGTAKKMADDFFGRFSEVVAPATAEIETVVVEDETGEAVAPRPVPHEAVEAPAAEKPEPDRAPEAARAPAAEAAPQPEARAVPAAADSEAEAREEAPPEPAGRPRGLSPIVWVAGVIALAVGLIVAFAV